MFHYLLMKLRQNDLYQSEEEGQVNPADQDKTAFACPFATFRCKRMPFELRNAPANFQRLMDRFRNGFPNVNILVYLDDIIVGCLKSLNNSLKT
ncbi:transposon Ty3-I Gag-Pol polyprotein [Trichonephila inaurata madagascariensis]|uniref:Transposon Ty3-I Gag-Pol polyprotein n=1 Tax=Trichonephila inaurata madagascariensis TaxID=2747483 RepID=A0A8X6XSI7_9ARAC|nr:transposon Ty3-I Gag-Pol polyprotein [Trichonephila inaurata madagascariensis]